MASHEVIVTVVVSISVTVEPGGGVVDEELISVVVEEVKEEGAELELEVEVSDGIELGEELEGDSEGI